MKSIVALAEELGVSLYSFTEDEVRRANIAVPYYVPSIIESGIYAGIGKDINTVGVSAVLFTHANS